MPTSTELVATSGGTASRGSGACASPMGWLLGERWRVVKPPLVVAGAAVDWWSVAERSPHRMVLRGYGWTPGDAWLGYHVDGDRFVQVGALRTKGVIGFLYWTALVPVHRRVFLKLARHRLTRASMGGGGESARRPRTGSSGPRNVRTP